MGQVIDLPGDNHKRSSPQAPKDQCRSSRIAPAPNPRLSRSVEYGIAILELFSSGNCALGIAEMAAILGISRSTTHRYAISLVALGYLEQDPKRKYRLSARAGGPGWAAMGAIRNQVPARAALKTLRDETGHTVSMGVLDRTRVIYVERLFGHRREQYLIDMDMGVGAAVPVYCTAIGKALLASCSRAEIREILGELQLVPYGPNSIIVKSKLAAELDEIDVREPVLSDEEFIAGSRSIALLIPRPANEDPLAIELTAPSGTYTREHLVKDMGPRLKQTARLIAAG